MKNTFNKLVIALIKCDIGFEVIRTEKALIIYFHNFEGKSFFFIFIKEDLKNPLGLLVFLSDIHKNSVICPTLFETKGADWETYITKRCFSYKGKSREGGIISYGSIEKEINEQNFNTNFVKEINKVLKF